MKALVEFLVAFSLLVTAVQGWLVVNKTWPRRAQPEVVESYSIGGYTLGLVNGLPFLAFYVIRIDVLSLIGQAIAVGLYVYFVLFAAGFWLPRRQPYSLATLIRRAFRQEAHELRNLSSIIHRQKDRQQILAILGHVASVDATLSSEEKALLAQIAESWGVDTTNFSRDLTMVREDHMVAITQLTDAFLSTKPSLESAHTLIDMIHMMIDADFVREPEERAVASEVAGRVASYTSTEAPPPRYEVVVVTNENRPESGPQTATTRTTREFGGTCNTAGAFFDPVVALIVCERLRSPSTTAVVVDREYSSAHRLPLRSPASP